ncbi:MAG: peptide deformylase [Lachnospiraceae bacterium]|nr:peptide deformylase [Lachnospiraceae bacterium]
MALRTIRIQGDPVLEKVCRPIEKMTPKIKTLIEDMFETMYEKNGVGLAGPQVGVLRRIAVIDTDGTPYVFINPKIVATDGEQTGDEGCLSIPGKSGTVTRPNYVKVEALDKNMEPFTLEATELLARAVCHELEHLDGILYTTHVEGELHDVYYDEEELEEEE